MVRGMAAAGWSDAGTQLPEWLRETGVRDIDPGERTFWWQGEDPGAQASYAADVMESGLLSLAQLPETNEEELRVGPRGLAQLSEPPRRRPRLGRAQVDRRPVALRDEPRVDLDSIVECARPART